MGLLFEWFVLGAALIVWYRHWTRVPRRVPHSPTPHRLARPVPAQPHWWARLYEEWGTVRGPSGTRVKLCTKTFWRIYPEPPEALAYVEPPQPEPENVLVLNSGTLVPEPEPLPANLEIAIAKALQLGLSRSDVALLMGGRKTVTLAHIKAVADKTPHISLAA